MRTSFKVWELTGAKIAETGVTPLSQFASAELREIHVKLRDPRQAMKSRLVHESGDKIEGELFISRADAREFIRDLIQPHLTRLDDDKLTITRIRERLLRDA